MADILRESGLVFSPEVSYGVSIQERNVESNGLVNQSERHPLRLGHGLLFNSLMNSAAPKLCERHGVDLDENFVWPRRGHGGLDDGEVGEGGLSCFPLFVASGERHIACQGRTEQNSVEERGWKRELVIVELQV